MKMWWTKGKWFYLEYNIRLFFYLLGQKPAILNANDLDTLLANYLVAKIRRLPLVYDSHEYFTEVPELIHRPATRRIWLALERWIFPRLTYVYTVNESIAKIYREKYQTPVQVIRNLPFYKPMISEISALIQERESRRILIYQGALNLGRGIDLMIRSMEFLEGYTLWIIGRGDVENELQELVSALPYKERIVFMGFMPLEKLAAYTREALLGFSLEEDLGANYRYASPNKVHDYIQALVPVIVSDLPEMRALVSAYSVGEVLTERKPQALATCVLAMTQDIVKLSAYMEACKRACEELCWEKEVDRLKNIYKLAAKS